MRFLRPRTQSLTQRFGLLVAALIVSATVLLGLSAASGVYQMAQREESARHRAYLDVATQQIENRLSVARRVVTSLRASESLTAGDAAAIDSVVSNTVLDNAEYIALLCVVSDDGTLVASFPGDPGLGAGELVSITSGVVGQASASLVWRPSSDDEPGQLWEVLPFLYRSGDRGFLMARLDTEPIDSALQQVADARNGPMMAILTAAGSPVFATGGVDVFAGGDFTYQETEGERQAEVSVSMADGSRYEGFQTVLGGSPGWQLVVLESSETAVSETWSALRPAVLTWSATAVFILVTALGMVTWLVRPLRDLERRVNAVARGAYTDPIRVTRQDEIGRLLEAFNSVAARLDRMHDVSQVLARSSEREEVLDGILVSVSHMLNSADVDILLLTEDGRELELTRASGALFGRVGTRLPRDTSRWLTHAIRNGGAMRYEGDPAQDVLLVHHGAHDLDALAAPLVVGLDTLGLIVVVRSGERFSDAEFEMLRSFAAQSSVAVHNARLFGEERRSRREAEVLLTVAERIARTGELDVAIDEVLAVESDLFGMQRRLVAIFDRKEYGLPPSEEPELEARLVEAWTTLFAQDFDAHAGARVMFLVGDSAADSLKSFMGEMGVVSMVLTALVVDDELVGLLVVGSPDTVVRVTPRQVRVAEVIGTQLSLALQNEMLFEKAKLRADNLETVFRISQAVSSSLQSKVVLNRVLDVVQKIFSADAVILMTYDTDRRTLMVPMARGLLHRDLVDAEFTPGEDLPGRVFVTKQPERYDSLDGVDTYLARVATGQGLESLLVVPLLARGRSIGVLSVMARGKSAFRDEDMELLRTFAAQASLAIDNASMFSREHHVANVLQQSILPTQLPQIEGLDSSSIYLPAGTEAEIGGDYYDLFKAPDGRVVMAIGDVCGKGVSAATKTSMLKYAVRGMVVAGMEPAALLREVNKMLVESGDVSDIVTLWIGFLDIEGRRLMYANGGHPAALLLHPADRTLERLSTTGALLGAVANAEYDQCVVDFEAGATLLLYTDGVTEARNKNRFFGEGRVRRALKPGGSAAVVAQRLLAQVQRFSSGELRDDAAILAVRILAGGDPPVVSSQ